MPDQINYGWLEEELTQSLNPVMPRQEFVSKLKQRLMTPSNVSLETPSRGRMYIPAAAGLLGGIILIWAIKRMWNYLTRGR